MQENQILARAIGIQKEKYNHVIRNNHVFFWRQSSFN